MQNISRITLSAILMMGATSSLSADSILHVKTNKKSIVGDQPIPFYFCGLIGYQTTLYLAGNESNGMVWRYDAAKRAPKPNSLLMPDAAKTYYGVNNGIMTIKISYNNVMPSAGDQYQLYPHESNPSCVYADQIGGRQDKLLLCMQSI